jgi:IS1 family transposase
VEASNTPTIRRLTPSCRHQLPRIALNILSRDKQIDIISALTEGMSIRATERLTGVHRDTIMRLSARVGRGCAELHDRMMVGLRPGRVELDELWAYVAKKQKRVTPKDAAVKGDQYTFVALAGAARAIISYHTGKRDSFNTDRFIWDLRERVIGAPEISADGWTHYPPVIREAFGNRVPAQISTSYVERQHLTLRMSSKRFARLGNGFSKKLENHEAAVSLYVAHYNLCRVHEALRATPAMALGVAERVWSTGDLIDAALATQPVEPVTTAPDRRRRFRVIEGGMT